MFDQTFVTGNSKTFRPWTMILSVAVQTLGVAALVILPLLHVAALRAPEKMFYYAQIHVPPRPHAEPRRQTSPHTSGVHRNVFTAPRVVPNFVDRTPDPPGIAPVIDDPPDAGDVIMPAVLPVFQPPAPGPAPVFARPAPPQPLSPVRVSEGAQAARLTFSPKPDYPALAKAARVEGVVRLEAVIGRDGAIRNLRVVSGPPLLVAAALSAVERWRYQPTLLNSEPVEVATEIEVHFTLSR